MKKQILKCYNYRRLTARRPRRDNTALKIVNDKHDYNYDMRFNIMNHYD